MKYRVIIFFIAIFLSCQQENKKTVEKDGIKQTQYFDKEGKVYKVDNFEDNKVYSTTYLLKDMDSTIYRKDTAISVIKRVKDRVYLIKNYTKNKQLISTGTLINQGEESQYDFVPLYTWIFYEKGKLTKFYNFSLNEENDICLTKVIYFDSNENKKLDKSHFISVTKENGKILLTLYSCCYKAKKLLINGEEIKPIAENKWYIDEKYLAEDHTITGEIQLNKDKDYPFLISEPINDFPRLELSSITYFREEVPK